MIVIKGAQAITPAFAVSVIAIGIHLYVAYFIKSNDYILHHGHKSIQAALLQSQPENKYNSTLY